MSDTRTIAFIGGGHIATALIGGLATASSYRLRVFDLDRNKAEKLAQQYGAVAYDSTAAAISGADGIVLAVKPDTVCTVCADLASNIDQNQLIISVAAGVRIDAMHHALGMSQAAIVRAMPNTPALVGSGATGLYAGATVDMQQKQMAEATFQSVGCIVWVENEQLLDAVTALSGSGPAYFLFLMDALIEAGKEAGLSVTQATALTIATARGAAELARTSDADCKTLCRNIAVAGGTTEAALSVFTDAGFSQVVEKAVRAAAMRSAELAKQYAE